MGNSEETLLTHEVITEWGPYHVECGPCHTVYKALHENDYNVEIERSLCDFFPQETIIMHHLELSIIYLKKMRRMGKEEGAGSLTHVLVQFSCKSALIIL